MLFRSPPEFFGRRNDYVDAVGSWCADAVAAGADSIDAYCDKGRFSAREAKWILNAGRAAGLLPRLHAGGDGRSGAAQLAAELGCASADLLSGAKDEDVTALAQAGVVAVLCPANLSDSRGLPPVRALLDKGVPIALGSGHAPGANGITSMPLVISLAISTFGMSVTEALRAATVGGAQALRAADRGAMARGKLVDIVAWDADHEGAFAWSYGVKPVRVWRGGESLVG